MRRSTLAFLPIAVLLGLVLVSCGDATPPPEDGPLRPLGTWGFEPGGMPPGISIVSGEWDRRPDPESERTVFAQIGASPGPMFNLLLVDGSETRDLDVRTRVRPVSGEIDRGGGLVWRAKDGGNYYVCRWNPLESNFRIYKVVEGARIQLASAAAPGEGGWREMRATMRGDRIECWLDGEMLLSVEDDTLSEAGRVGLWTKADAVTLFDGLTLSGDGE